MGSLATFTHPSSDIVRCNENVLHSELPGSRPSSLQTCALLVALVEGWRICPSKPGSEGRILGKDRTARPDSRPPSCPHSLLAEPALACCLLASSVSSARWTQATALLCALLSGTVRSFGLACLYPGASHGTVFAGLALRGLGSMPEQRDSIPITLFVWGVRGHWRLCWH